MTYPMEQNYLNGTGAAEISQSVRAKRQAEVNAAKRAGDMQGREGLAKELLASMPKTQPMYAQNSGEQGLASMYSSGPNPGMMVNSEASNPIVLPDGRVISVEDANRLAAEEAAMKRRVEGNIVPPAETQNKTYKGY